MKKWFNTAGPCQADIHYMLPSTDRLPEIVNLMGASQLGTEYKYLEKEGEII